MIWTWVFVIGFVALGLSVVFAAMSGGPRGAREALHTGSRGGRKAVYAGVALVIVGTGIAIPAVVMSSNAADDSNGAPGGVQLTAGEADGRQIFTERCATCHILDAANAVGRVGPNLDELRPPVALTLDAIEKGRARGQGQMPAGLVDGEQAEHVAEFIAKTAGR